LEGAELIPLAKNRSFRNDDGEFNLDAGPFVAALEFAIDYEALVLGKRSPEFFKSALASMGARRARLQ
jgi:ribonucleotide monophosphatase NagD (HAD superfamily)